MAIAFAGLLFSQEPVLNQISFFMVMAVLLDTLIVRTILVPALMIVLGPANWWPRRVPDAHPPMDLDLLTFLCNQAVRMAAPASTIPHSNPEYVHKFISKNKSLYFCMRYKRKYCCRLMVYRSVARFNSNAPRLKARSATWPSLRGDSHPQTAEPGLTPYRRRRFSAFDWPLR